MLAPGFKSKDSSRKQYTDAEKAAYWKAKAQGTAPPPKKYKKKKTTTKRSTTRTPKSAGYRVGSAIGGWIGNGVQNLITKLTGFGDYMVHENSIFQGGIGILEIKNTNENGGVIIRHREYLGPVLATVDFTNTVYPLNPGLSGTFPWGSKPSNAFEQWKMRGAVAEFVSTSSDSVLSTNTSSALGQVMIATQYDSLTPPFSSKMEMLNHEFSNSRKPSESFVHPIECKTSLTPQQLFYVRDGALPLGADERLYDLGLLQIATQGMQAVGGSIGDLWITYELELYKPCINPGAPIGSILSDHFQLVTWSNANPLGTASVLTSTSSMRGQIVNGGGYRFPPYVIDGNFLVTINWRGSSPSAYTPPTLTPINGAFKVLFETDTTNFVVGPNSGIASQSDLMTFIFNVNTTSAQVAGFNLSATGVLPGAANIGADLFVTQLDDDMNNLTHLRRLKHHHPKMLYMPGDVFPYKGPPKALPPPQETPDSPDDSEASSSSSSEYVRVKKSSLKRKSVTLLKDDTSNF